MNQKLSIELYIFHDILFSMFLLFIKKLYLWSNKYLKSSTYQSYTKYAQNYPIY